MFDRASTTADSRIDFSAIDSITRSFSSLFSRSSVEMPVVPLPLRTSTVIYLQFRPKLIPFSSAVESILRMKHTCLMAASDLLLSLELFTMHLHMFILFLESLAMSALTMRRLASLWKNSSTA